MNDTLKTIVGYLAIGALAIGAVYIISIKDKRESRNR